MHTFCNHPHCQTRSYRWSGMTSHLRLVILEAPRLVLHPPVSHLVKHLLHLAEMTIGTPLLARQGNHQLECTEIDNNNVIIKQEGIEY